MKKVYHVTKTDDGWQGKAEGGSKASVVGSTKEEVLQKTIDIAKNCGDAQVKVHKANGKFQEERTYGKDPYPPAG